MKNLSFLFVLFALVGCGDASDADGDVVTLRLINYNFDTDTIEIPDLKTGPVSAGEQSDIIVAPYPDGEVKLRLVKEGSLKPEERMEEVLFKRDATLLWYLIGRRTGGSSFITFELVVSSEMAPWCSERKDDEQFSSYTLCRPYKIKE